MKNTRNNELSDRRSASADAKTALLNAYRTAKTAAEPINLARQGERVKLVESERRVTEAAEQLHAVADEVRAATEALEKSRITSVIEDEAARKAERDRQYANRKARQAQVPGPAARR